MKKKKKKSILKKISIIIISIILLIFIVIGSYIYGVFGSAHRAANSSFAPLKTTKSKTETTESLSKNKPFSVLLLGIDSRDSDLKGRSDSMIVATVNPLLKKTTLISIPRDTYVDGTTINKINSAYADGGPENAMNHVNSLLNIKLEHYVTLNFDGLVKLVDSVGGVDISSPIAFDSSHTIKQEDDKIYHFNEGMNHLNGMEALAYSRERYNDPNGDYGRQNRQTQIIAALLKKLESTQTLTNYNQLFNILGGNVKTDFTWDHMKSLISNYNQAFKSTSNFHLKGEGKTINGLSYQIAPQSEIDRIHNIITAQLKG